MTLHKQKCHLESMVSSVQRQSNSRLHNLQRQVSELGSQAHNIQRSNEKISDLCADTDLTPRNSVDLSYLPNDYMTRSHCELHDKPRRNRISYVEDGSALSASFDDSVFIDEPGVLRRSQSLRPSKSHRLHKTRHSPDQLSPPITSTPNRPSTWAVQAQQSTPFSRTQSFRAPPVTPIKSSSRNPFSRSDPARASMPERQTMYVTPEQRKHKNPPVAKVRPASASYQETDSGHTSPDSPKTMSTIEQILSTISITTTESVKKHGFKMPKTGDKYRILVSKIVELQDRNQQLVLENTEIKRVISKIRYSVERIDAVEKKNIDLEIENRRLSKICASLQSANSSKEPKDCPYHYYSSV